ncbi:MAG: site-specific integrase, partial [Cryobacterium sp.]|nr:site-specific integrase [Cryobacterium sp.]
MSGAGAGAAGGAVAAAVDSYLRHVAIERGLSTNTVSAYRRDLAIYSRWLAAENLTG